MSFQFVPDKCINQLPFGLKNLQPLLDKMHTSTFHSELDKVDSNELCYDIRRYSDEEIKFIYSVTSMMAHRYIYLSNKRNIPDVIGILWRDSANYLGLPTVLTHSAVDLWNYSRKCEEKGNDLDNLKCNYLMTGTVDEEWFYLIMTKIEMYSTEIIPLINDNSDITKNLKHLCFFLEEMDKIINRIFEKCKPDVFFHLIRKHLEGSYDNPIYVCGKKISKKGGSAAQSTLIQVIDKYLDNTSYPKHANNFLVEMREYMPEKDRNFLYSVTPLNREHFNNEQKFLYNKCINALIKFRKSHFNIIHKYILVFIPKKKINKKNDCWHRFTDWCWSWIYTDNPKGTGGTDITDFISTIITNNSMNKIKSS